MNAPVAATEDLTYTIDNGIAHLTFNRPQARNAMTFAMYEQIARICDAVNGDRSMAAMVLTGAGDKAFAAGTDIAQFRAFKTAGTHRLRGADRSRDGPLVTVRVPTIAAIAGACPAAARASTRCCDIRIGTPQARIGRPDRAHAR